MRGVVVVLALLAAPRAIAGDRSAALVVIVNSANTARPDSDELEAIFLRKTQRWPGGATIVPVNAPPDSPNRRAFDRAVLRMSPDEVAKYWLDQRIRTGQAAPREVDDPALALKLVTRLAGAIAYVPETLDVGDARIVARIRDDKLTPP